MSSQHDSCFLVVDYIFASSRLFSAACSNPWSSYCSSLTADRNKALADVGLLRELILGVH